MLLNVLLPYKITLLQNIIDEVHAYDAVLLPYEFTLLQNWKIYRNKEHGVLLPYEITLLQNLKRGLKLLPMQKSRKYTTPKPINSIKSIC